MGEVAGLRRRLEAEAALATVRPNRSPRGLVWAAVAAAAIVVIAVLRFSEGPRQTPLPDSAGIETLPAPVTAADAGRQLQFVTSAGTRIVWVLSPNLNL